MATLNIKGFPDPLYEALKQRAELDCRSLTQEIIFLLQIAVKETKKSSILELRGLGKKIWKNVKATEHIELERESWE